MRVLIVGASGFIGRHLAVAVRAAGHQVVCGLRNSGPIAVVPGSGVSSVAVDFTRDCDAATWIPRLVGIDAVINAVGILQQRGPQTFETIHVAAPQALFSACVAAKVRRVIQISALGADESARTLYHLSKRRADEFLARLPVEWTIVQPSLVFGAGGTSARMFATLASLPAIPLPGDGEQQVQPIHVDDLVGAIVRLLETNEYTFLRIPLVGPRPLTWREFVLDLRSALGLGKAALIRVPLPLVRLGARLSRFSPFKLLDQDTLAMLLRGNTGDARPVARLLGRSAKPVQEFIPALYASPLRQSAQLLWLLPLLRWSVATVWIVTGLLSLGIYPTDRSYELLARVGVTGTAAPVFLYGAALLDLCFGLASLFVQRRSWLWLSQIAVIAGYTALITWRLPEFWLHPYGPVLKNIPLLAAIWLLYVMERR